MDDTQLRPILDTFSHLLTAAYFHVMSATMVEGAKKLMDRVREIRERRGTTGRTVPVPARMAKEMFEGAALEDDEYMRDLWAGLIVNATDPERRSNVRRLYIRILGQLDPVDVRVLDFLCQEGDAAVQAGKRTKFQLSELASRLDLPPDTVLLSLHSLANATCLLSQGNSAFGSDDTESDFRRCKVFTPEATFEVTSTAFGLHEACAQ